MFAWGTQLIIETANMESVSVSGLQKSDLCLYFFPTLSGLDWQHWTTDVFGSQLFFRTLSQSCVFVVVLSLPEPDAVSNMSIQNLKLYSFSSKNVNLRKEMVNN